MSRTTNFKVTVLIAVYNAEKFVQKAVECALEQEEVGEVILIEDASPDNALNVCEALAAQYPKVKLIQHPDKQNHGAPASWNLGIQMAVNDYIAICGADDFYLPGRFKKDKAIFEADTTVEGVYNAIDPIAIDSDGKFRIDKSVENRLILRRTLNHPYTPETLFENMAPIGAGGFFCLNGLTVKKVVFEKTGLLDASLRLSQDTDISIKMSAVCKLVAGELNQPVAMYGVHKNNRSHNGDKLTLNRPSLFRNLFQWAIEKNIQQSRIFILWQRYYEYNLVVHKPNRKQQIIILLRELINYPRLIKSHFFLKQLPLIHRFLL